MNLLLVLSPYLVAFIYFVAVYRKSHSPLSAAVSTTIIGVVTQLFVPGALLVLGTSISPTAGAYVMIFGYPPAAAIIYGLAYRFRILWKVSPTELQATSAKAGRFAVHGTVLMVMGMLTVIAPFIISSTTGYAWFNPFFLIAILVPIGLIVTLVGYYVRMR